MTRKKSNRQHLMAPETAILQSRRVMTDNCGGEISMQTSARRRPKRRTDLPGTGQCRSSGGLSWLFMRKRRTHSLTRFVGQRRTGSGKHSLKSSSKSIRAGATKTGAYGVTTLAPPRIAGRPYRCGWTGRWSSSKDGATRRQLWRTCSS